MFYKIYDALCKVSYLCMVVTVCWNRHEVLRLCTAEVIWGTKKLIWDAIHKNVSTDVSGNKTYTPVTITTKKFNLGHPKK